MEFDIIRNGKNLSFNYFNYQILAGLDYEPGSKFVVINLGPKRIFLYPRRADINVSAGELKGKNILEFVKFGLNQVPDLTHYKISPFSICLPQDNSYPWQCFENNKEIILNELQKRNRRLDDLYLYLAYGICDQTGYNCVWFNLDDANNPPVFYLENQ